MKIGLIDVDGHNYPNLPLMKLSACRTMRSAERWGKNISTISNKKAMRRVMVIIKNKKFKRKTFANNKNK